MKRTCRFCGKSGRIFYPKDTTSGIAAGNCCKACWVAKSVKWRNENKRRWNKRRHFLKVHRLFGITQKQFAELYRNKPRCGGCSKTKSMKGRRLVIDHNHATGLIRGLLCHDCNRTIATAHDNPAILRNLADYLEAF